MLISLQWFHEACNNSTTTECLVSMAKRRKLKSGLYCLWYWIYKTQILSPKAEVMLGANIVWLASTSDLLVILKCGLSWALEANEPKIMFISFESFHKTSNISTTFESFDRTSNISTTDRMLGFQGRKRKLKSGLYFL